jgi:acyl transferase domain-containing protein
LDELAAYAEEKGVRARRVPVDYASHGVDVEEIRSEIETGLAGITPLPSRVPVLSTVTGETLDTTTMGPAYWYANLRQTVRFAEAVGVAAGLGHRHWVEVSAHPVLSMAVEETVETVEAAVVTGTLRRDEGGADRLIASAAELWAGGGTVDWAAVFAGRTVERVDLPTYPFQRRRFWLEVEASDRAASSDPAERGFWAAVEREDVEALSAVVPVNGDQESWRSVLPDLAAWRRQQRESSAVASWRFAVAWRPVSLPPAGLSGRWLLVVPDGVPGWPEAVRSALIDGGAEVVPVPVAVAEVDRDGLAAQLASAAGDEPVAGVVSLLALAGQPRPGHEWVAGGVAATLALVQALEPAGIGGRLWCVTAGAVSAGRDDVIVSPGQAEVWGLGRVAALEQSARWGGVLDLPSEVDDRAAGRVAAVVAQRGEDMEDQVAVRAAGCFGRRMVPAPLAATPARQWAPRGTVLITGGTGALGMHLARWLAGKGAPHLVLTSRRGRSAPGAEELARELAGLGARVTIAACDVTDRSAVAGLVGRLDADGERITAAFHAAVGYELGALAETTVDQYATVVSAKVAGVRHLEELLDGRELDAFVVYSSIAALWGSGDHGAYAAANAHVDAWAQQRRQRGLPATAVAWGVWDAVNEYDSRDATDRPRLNQRAVRQGLPLLDPTLALAALQQVLDHDETCVAVADIEWDRFVELFLSTRPSHLLDELPQAQRPTEAEAGGSGSPLRERLAGLPPDELDRELLELVRSHAAAALGHDGPDGVEPARAFRELGFDSLTSVSLRNRLTAATGLRLPTTLVFDHPTPAALAGHLRDELQDGGATTVASVHAQLDQLGAALATVAASPAERADLTSHLQGLLSRWTATPATPAGPGGPAVEESSVADKLQGASDDEVFAFINEQLGRSR